MNAIKLLISIIIVGIPFRVGAQWNLVFANNDNISRPGEFHDIYFKNDTTGIVVGDYNTGIVRTHDGGSTWYYDHSSFRNDLYRLAFANSDSGMVVVTNNYVYFTNDGGNTFKPGNWNPPIIGHLSSNDYEMISRKIIYTVGNKGKIVKTTDAGLNWKTYGGFSFTNSLYKITCLNANICYACGSAGKIVKTIDGGNVWIEQESYLNNDLFMIYLLSSDFAVAAGAQGALLTTTDGGENWNQESSKASGTIIGLKFWTPDFGYLVSSFGEISFTKDGGKTWFKLNVSPLSYNYYFNKIYFKDRYTIFGVFDDKIYMCKITDNQLITQIEDTKPEQIDMIYDPLGKELVIANYSESSIGQVEIISMAGAKLLVENKVDYPIHHINFGYYKPGVYLIKLVNYKDKNYVKRIIIQ